MKRVFRVSIRCQSCVKGIKEALLEISCKGRVDFASSEVIVEDDTPDAVVIRTLQNLGYEVEKASNQRKRQEAFVPLFCTVCMLPFLLHMVGVWGSLSSFLQLFLASSVFIVIIPRLFKRAFKSLLQGHMNMDLLLGMGVLMAYGMSVMIVFGNLPYPLYFEAAVVIVTATEWGKYLEGRMKKKTFSTLETLVNLLPQTGRVKRSEWVDVPIEKIERGEKVLVKAGERIPVDGEVLEGESFVDEGFITGESLLVKKGVGSQVHGGAINWDGVLTLQAKGGRSSLEDIVDFVEKAKRRPSSYQKLADRVSGFFIPGMLTVGLVTFLVTGFVVGWFEGMVRGLTVLVAACPCALGLATPIVVAAALGKGLKKGILVRDVIAMEKAHQITTILLDKTGTLTEGKPRVFEHVREEKEASFWDSVYSLELRSEHPLAKGVREYAQSFGGKEVDIEDFTLIPGKGVIGKVKGKKWGLGSYSWIEEKGVKISQVLKKKSEEALKRGAGIVCCFCENQVLASFFIEDGIRPQSYTLVKELKKMGMTPILATGDRREVADHLGDKLGLGQVFSECLPEDKAKIIQKLQAKGEKVAMVGDGINDAPALAQSDVSFAMGQGAHLALETSDFNLLKGDVSQVVFCFQLSRQAFRKMQQNLFFAFAYNSVAVPLACLGISNPFWAAIGMAVSSLLVVGNGWVLLQDSWFKEKTLKG